MSTSLDESFHMSTSMGNFPCIFVDHNGGEVSDDSVVTFGDSFYGNCSFLEESTGAERPQKQQVPQQVPRLPRRRTSFVHSSSNLDSHKFGLKPPKRRSTKSSFDASQHERRSGSNHQSTANAMIQCRLQSLTTEQDLRRVQALERFQEEPQPRTSLELPAVPQRKQSILQFSTSQLLNDEDHEDDFDIARVLASLSQE